MSSIYIWIKYGDAFRSKDPLVIGLLIKIKPSVVWNDCAHKKASMSVIGYFHCK